MKDTSWYRTGTLTVLTGAVAATGAGVGSWEANCSAGDILIADGKVMEITGVQDAVGNAGVLDLAMPFPGPDFTGDYAIIRSYNHIMPSGLAVRIAATLQSYQVTLDQLMYWMTGGGDGSTEHMTLSNFAGVDGLTVPTLPNLAPLAASLSLTPAPHKVPQADANGKLDMNWLPTELINAVLGSGIKLNPNSSSTSVQKLKRVYVDSATATVAINSKDARFFDIVVNYAGAALTLNVNYVNVAPTGTDLLHAGVPTDGALDVLIRVFDNLGGATVTWVGSPITWSSAGSQGATSGIAESVSAFRLRWLNTEDAPVGFPNVSFWLGDSLLTA